jgi:putative SOS response-associated peptidase YedK
MCGRYALKSSRKTIAAWFGVVEDDLPPFGENFNVAPQTFQPVVRLSPQTGEREIVLLRWGLIPAWARSAREGAMRFNARAEDLASKPSFREALRKRRCLVPADAFYEWQKLGPKQKRPYAIAMKDGGLYAFAGLWERWKEPQGDWPEGAEGGWLETFTIITTDPNELMEPFHNRMPVIIARKDYDCWLGSEASDDERLPLDLLRPFPAEEMITWRVGDKVGNVRNTETNLLEELSAEQLDDENLEAAQQPKPAKPKATKALKKNDDDQQGSLFS